MLPYRAVCFDFDYTLGDSTDAIVSGFQYGLTELGWPAPSREQVRGTIGYLLEDAYTMLTGDDDPERRAKFRPLFLEVAHERQKKESTLFPGAVELLNGLHRHGVKLGIVSTKGGDTIQGIFARYGLLDQMSVIIGTGNVHRPKPDPEGLNLALAQLGLAPEEMLFCGDTIMDAGAAKNAGAWFAAVLNGTTPREAFSDWPHQYIAEDLFDLARWLEV